MSELAEKVAYILKMRKRHVRLARERLIAKISADESKLCELCRKPSRARFDDATYLGHFCENGHVMMLARRLWDPSAPRPKIERASPQGFPSANPITRQMTAAATAIDMQKNLSAQKQFQQTIESQTGDGWRTT